MSPAAQHAIEELYANRHAHASVGQGLADSTEAIGFVRPEVVRELSNWGSLSCWYDGNDRNYTLTGHDPIIGRWRLEAAE